MALLLGWGPVGAMVMGGVTYISSSGIAAKVITDLGRIGNRETPVVLSILVFEDLAMAVYLPILTATLAGVSFLGGLQTVGISLAVVTVVLLVALRHGHRVSKAVHSENSEVFLLNLLGAALAGGRRCRRPCRCRPRWGRSCSASPFPAPRPTARRGSSSHCATCSPPSSSWPSGSNPAIKLATSTPKADPSGDYAFEAFRKAETLRPNARAELEKKALQLTGGAASAAAPAGRNPYGWHIAEGRADIFLAYCTAARDARRENAELQTVALPETLAVSADYGMTVTNGASPGAWQFALFILSSEGQRILASHGFSAPNLPE